MGRPQNQVRGNHRKGDKFMTQVMEPIRQVTADKKISLTKIMVLTDFSGV
jgi:hypothetical protein